MDARSLEAQACNEGFALAKDLILSHVIIGSDCMQVVLYINGTVVPFYALVWSEIRDRARDFARVSFCCDNRKTNLEAHALVKAASSLPAGRHMWLGILPDIICISSVSNVE